jgi:HAE1 family hydrophobic/amphiphilic exporter-1
LIDVESIFPLGQVRQQLGALPIALGFGAGAESRRPLGLAVLGGLLFSQLVTLYLTPMYYTYLEALVERVRGVGARPVVATAEPVRRAGVG